MALQGSRTTVMSAADLLKNRAAFSSEVFPPKADAGKAKLCGKESIAASKAAFREAGIADLI